MIFFQITINIQLPRRFLCEGYNVNVWHIAKSRVLQIDYIVDTVKDKEIVKSTC